MSTFTDSEIDTLELPKEEEKKEEPQEKNIVYWYYYSYSNFSYDSCLL